MPLASRRCSSVFSTSVQPSAPPAPTRYRTIWSAKIGSGPWAVTYGPSTRRWWTSPTRTHSLGINPVGRDGVPFDGHYDDQAEAYIEGHYLPQYYEETR